jgi:hypothetical protein
MNRCLGKSRPYGTLCLLIVTSLLVSVLVGCDSEKPPEILLNMEDITIVELVSSGYQVYGVVSEHTLDEESSDVDIRRTKAAKLLALAPLGGESQRQKVVSKVCLTEKTMDESGRTLVMIRPLAGAADPCALQLVSKGNDYTGSVPWQLPGDRMVNAMRSWGHRSPAVPDGMIVYTAICMDTATALTYVCDIVIAWE